jgi:hypothetical protein
MMPEYLGTPLDANFQPIPGGGTTVFPGAPILGMQSDDFRHERIEIDDSVSFNANVSVWAPVISLQAGVGRATDYRFAAYRAYDVHFVSLVDDRYPHSAPPPGAVWYPARIYWGHSYEQVCYGDSRTFNASVAASFKILEGDLGSFASSNHLQCKLLGRGLTPSRPNAIYAGSPEQARRYYTDTGPVAPVFVEYRLIPGVLPPAPSAVQWLAPYPVTVRFNAIHVAYQTNWLKARWIAQGFCLVNGQEAGVPSMAVNGDEVTDDTQLTANWVARLMVAPGDRIACGLEGAFQGAWKSGQIARGMTPDIPITGPAALSGSFTGSNADTRYSVQYTVTVEPPAPR